MDPALRVIDYVREGGEVIHTAEGTLSASVMLERFLFPPDQQYSYIEKLSGGERRRLYLLRILMEAPNVLFLDEPTGALDEETGRKILDYIWKLKEKLGFTLIMVTHNQNIADMARTIIRVNSGKITEVVTNDQPQTTYEIGW